MTEAKGSPAATEVAKPYQPTPREKGIIDAFNRYRSEHATPGLKAVEADGNVSWHVNHADESIGHLLLGAAIGARDNDFHKGLLTQLIRVNGLRNTDEAALNFMLSAVQGVEPRDQNEAMLAAQMATAQCLAMKFARLLMCADTIAECESAERIYNRLCRTFALQMETLKRYRSTGEQRVTVQHVTVNEGGQAIVGTVDGRPAGGGDGKKKRRQPHAKPTGDAPVSEV